MKEITFPQHEYPSIKGRLNQGKTFYTTRVSDELNKYKVGQRYKAPWGDILEVVSVNRITDLKDHKFFKELSDVEIKTLSRYKRMDHVELKRV